MNEDLMLSFFDRTLDLVCIVDKQGWFQRINLAVVKTLGYSEKELLSRPVSQLIHPDDREVTSIQRKKLLNNEPLINFQNRYITKDRRVIWLQWTSVYIPEKEVVFAIAKNITKKKQKEIEIEQDYLKYKNLTAHFKHHVEKDRSFFASELHEELAQLATVVKLDFELLASQKVHLDDVSKKRIEHGLTTSQLLIDKIRKLSYSISPARIEEIGLDSVLNSLCNEFTSMTGIKCGYKSAFDEKDLDYEIKLDLFRICQEALVNVMHHADATRVRITLQQKKNIIDLTVKDNGRGFEHESEKSFGLKNMRGRAESINGKLIIESKENKGTKVIVRVETKPNG